MVCAPTKTWSTRLVAAKILSRPPQLVSIWVNLLRSSGWKGERGEREADGGIGEERENGKDDRQWVTGDYQEKGN